MKSLLVTVITLTTLAASAFQEIPYDQNDPVPADQLRFGEDIRAKLVPHTNGQTYVVMYRSQIAPGQTANMASTQIVGLCNVGYKDSIERCAQDTDPVLQDVYKAVTHQNKPDCSKIALLNQDHQTTLKRIADYNSSNMYRDTESNARALLPITASLAYQVETLNTFVPSINMAENLRQTKQVMDDVANKRIQPYEALAQLVRRASGTKRDFATLMGASRCTEQDLQMCRFNKSNGELLTPEVNMDLYNKYIEVERKGLVEMRACSTAIAPQAPVATPAPTVLTQPEAAPIKTPAVTAPSVDVQAVDPTHVGQ